jgi:hypothetical protein
VKLTPETQRTQKTRRQKTAKHKTWR